MKTTHQDKLLDAAIRSLDDQPLTLGTVAVAVMRLMGNPNVGLTSLTRAIAADVGLTGKIIRKANCAFYAGSATVSSLPLAILKVGFTATRSVIVASAYQNLFREGDPDGLEQRLWRHSLAVGIGARTIAHHADGSFGEEAFVCGLVHDVAKLVLLQRFPDVYRPIMQRSIASDAPLLDIEMTTMGFTHAELGAMILERWSFEPAAVRAVLHHHNPANCGMPDDPNPVHRDATHLAHAIHMANAIARQLESPAPGSPAPMLDGNAGLQYFGFSPDQLNLIVDEMRFRVGDELQIFGEGDTPMF